ncbi:hypothetical protein PG994_015326 [Apiospora phragmitis]|uniref:Uncharacterized protein n=1 Tax=Apiospora phragmitis TaxID=2905665 RepID=A0ABR1SSX6_9PEZI
MEGECYEFDPNGDVVLTLRSPNAPFAVWNEDEAQKAADSLTQDRAHTLTGLADPWLITYHVTDHALKHHLGADVLPATTPTEPITGPTPEPEANPFVEAPDESTPAVEPISDVSTLPEFAAEDTTTASEPAGPANMPCSISPPRADQPWNQADIHRCPAVILNFSPRGVKENKYFKTEAFELEINAQ